MKNNVYTEKQSFFTWWLCLLFVGLITYQLYPLMKGDNIEDSTSLYIGLAILMVLFLFFVFVRLRTTIDATGITVDFFPFVRNKVLKWEYIAEAYVVKYSITDFGGWGYRIGKNGIAYNTKGNQGLQLILKNGGRIMIGTQNPDEIKRIIETYSNSN